jgi:hypothetical protein
MNNNQIELIGKAIALAGSVQGLAKVLNVRRETVTRWFNNTHTMRLETYMELVKWLEMVEGEKKYIGSQTETMAG